MSKIKVAICDDHHLFRLGIRMILEGEEDITVVGEAANGLEALELARNTEIDVILMDVRMPELDGIETTARLITELQDSAPRVLVLTTFDLDEAVARSVHAGASGFILKAAEPALLLAAVRTIATGNQLFAASATSELIARYAAPQQKSATPVVPNSFQNLSERERDIFMHLARGLSNAEIAESEFLSVETVKSHVSKVLTKLGLRDRIQVVVFAYEHGLIQAEA